MSSTVRTLTLDRTIKVKKDVKLPFYTSIRNHLIEVDESLKVTTILKTDHGFEVEVGDFEENVEDFSKPMMNQTDAETEAYKIYFHKVKNEALGFINRTLASDSFEYSSFITIDRGEYNIDKIREEIVRKLIESGKSKAAISKLTGISERTIYRILNPVNL